MLYRVSRYVPLPPWAGWLTRGAGLEVPPGFESLYFLAAREALAYCLTGLKISRPGKTVIVLPVFICPAVIATVENLGLQVRRVDLSRGSLFPHPQTIQNSLDDAVLAVVSAPYFGAFRRSAFDLRSVLGEVPLILDLAQGIGCPYQDLDFDFAVFSFGLGKGIDYYGGALVRRRQIAAYSVLRGESLLHFVGMNLTNFCAGTVLRSRWLSSLLDPVIRQAEDGNKLSKPLRRFTALSRPARAVIAGRMSDFGRALGIARCRLTEVMPLLARRGIAVGTSDLDREATTYLRLPLVFENAVAADAFLDECLSRGIEATRPAEDGVPTGFSNYEDLMRRMLKLPFLGTLREQEYGDLRTAISRS